MVANGGSAISIPAVRDQSQAELSGQPSFIATAAIAAPPSKRPHGYSPDDYEFRASPGGGLGFDDTMP
jgi:hypothetical protein